MTREIFRDFCDRLAERPVTGRHLFLWVGDEEGARKLIPSPLVRSLDVEGVITDQLERARDFDTARRRIVRMLRDVLQGLPSPHFGQELLLVSSPELLARYNVGLSPFYDYYIGDRRAVLIVLRDYTGVLSVSGDLPDYVDFNPLKIVEYFVELIGRQNVIREQGV